MLNDSEVREIIEEVVIGIDASSLDEETLFSEAGVDSLDHASILLALEEKHGYKVPDKDADKCSSIKGILDYVKNLD